ncbi:Zn-dependent protease with chaperone function [Tumebacillus sp. BK434]|uniref:M48 family metallopeptidase n=1 Tax=Tumebacillus sp. BK434 TaxID=2512169 RepID=UPI0010E618CF|nr:M48 family metallopeptidase [Tumebacillus sp. BK434]TCP53936.1 Zn-dependent protease with chaperone function [Tumebacillus sp. BK434]
MRRAYLTLPLCFLILLASLWTAFYVYNDTSVVTEVVRGEAAHPLSFMSEAEYKRTTDFSRIKEALYFADLGFDWVVLLFVLAAGLSGRFRDTAVKLFKRSSFGQVTVYTVLFQLVTTLLELPLAWYRHMIDVNYGVSNMTPSAWFSELFLDFGLSTLMTVPVIWIAFLIIKKSPKRWWLWLWTATVPLLLFLIVIQPVFIDPLYNEFKPLQDQELKAKIIDLAHKANIPSENVYEVDMSKKTNALNAYVNGIGPSARIVLWDTTLNKLSEEEILFIMGHEMGHYVKHHMLWGLAGSLVVMLALFYLTAVLYPRIVRFMGGVWSLKGEQDLAALPVALLVLSLLGFLVSPAENYMQRVHEQVSDRYAVEITDGDVTAGITSFQKLSRLSLSDPNPSPLVKILLYSHPTLSERIRDLEQMGKEQNVSGTK